MKLAKAKNLTVVTINNLINFENVTFTADENSLMIRESDDCISVFPMKNIIYFRSEGTSEV